MGVSGNWGTLFLDPYNKDPTIQDAIFGSLFSETTIYLILSPNPKSYNYLRDPTKSYVRFLNTLSPKALNPNYIRGPTIGLRYIPELRDIEGSGLEAQASRKECFRILGFRVFRV